MQMKVMDWFTGMAIALSSAACQSGDPSVSVVDEQTSTGSLPSPEMDELERLDPRTPVPLQPMMAWHQKQNMMEHLVAIQQITDALAREDWEQIASASAQIGSSPEMKTMCERMGAGAHGFTERALEFHSRADAIGEAAHAHDGAAVLKAMSHTLQSCTACHAAFRQDIVSASEWERRTRLDHVPLRSHDKY